jgi:hypothetical protein
LYRFIQAPNTLSACLAGSGPDAKKALSAPKVYQGWRSPVKA